MKKLLLLLFIKVTIAAPFPYSLFYSYTGAKTVIAGSNDMAGITSLLSFNYTVNTSTSVFTITTSAVTLNNGDLIQFEETPGGTGWISNKLPSPLWGMANGTRPRYAVCNVSGSTFKVNVNTTAGIQQSGVSPTCSDPAVTITTSGTGTLTASILWRSGDTTYLKNDPTGYPMGTTFTYKTPVGTSECNSTAPTSSGKVYSPFEGQLCIIAAVPSGASTGAITVTITFCQTDTGTNCTDFVVAKTIVGPQTIIYTPPGSFTTPPSYTAWAYIMTNRPCPMSNCGDDSDYTTLSGPANFCNPLNNPTPVNSLGAGTSDGIGFYGWEIFFDNIAIFTGNLDYRNGCFSDAVSHSGIIDLQSVDYYVSSNNGSTNPYATFPETLWRACRVFNISSYCTHGALHQHYFINELGAKPGFTFMRENTYGLDIAATLKKYGNITLTYTQDIRDLVYSFLFRGTESDNNFRFPQQGFMVAGITAHAIILDWQVSGDTRAQYAVKRALDYIWLNYDQVNHRYMNLEGPDGSPWCIDGTLTSGYNWFVDGDGNCGTNPINYQELQSMLIQSFWWYYAMTGDTTYRTRGEDLAAHMFDNYSSYGKAASQAYYDSFNAYGWVMGTLSPYSWYGDAQSATFNKSITGVKTITGVHRIQ